jgi:hypothetical protein
VTLKEEGMMAARTAAMPGRTKTHDASFVGLIDALPEVTGYAATTSLFATRYKLGDRTVYSLDLTPAEIDALVPTPNPSVPVPGNRLIKLPHAKGFAQYVRVRKDWIAPGLLLRTPKTFDFAIQAEVAGIQFGVVSFPRRSAVDLHIIDGQHRVLGFHVAFEGIAADLEKARNALASARHVEQDGKAEQHARGQILTLEKQLDRLNSERIAVQIVVVASQDEYQQMFADISDNALGLPAGLRVRFDKTKLVNRALTPVLEHPLLQNRVNPESDRAGGTSPYLMGAKHVVEVIRSSYVGIAGRISKRQEADDKEADLVRAATRFLDALVEGFPSLTSLSLGQLTPEMLRRTSLLGSVIFVRVLAGAYRELTVNRAYSHQMVVAYFRKLAPHANGPAAADGIWVQNLPTVFTEGGMAPSGRRQDIALLHDTIVEWAIVKPGFLDAAPA